MNHRLRDTVGVSCSLAKVTTALNRARMRVVLSIITMCALAWAYLIYLVNTMPPMISGAAAMSMAMPTSHAWGLPDFTAMFVMWSVMMVAMMLPSAMPMILLFVKINQNRELQGRSRERVGLFIGGYLLVWIGFSAFATLLNWGLHLGGNLTSMMGRATPVVAGVTLLAAGLFQWSPLKHACLNHCRSPIGFLMAYWREGWAGTVRMGIHHGLYCLGCCWLLMALLFVLGVMNLLWIAALTLFVLAEKVVPAGQVLGRVAGLFMIAWGGWLISMAVQVN